MADRLVPPTDLAWCLYNGKVIEMYRYSLYRRRWRLLCGLAVVLACWAVQWLSGGCRPRFVSPATLSHDGGAFHEP